MAARGPAPKAPEERHRTKQPGRGEWVDLPELAKPILKPLPARDSAGERWRPEVRRLWNAWRADPVTQEWSQADIAYAEETIDLRNRSAHYGMAEIRLRMDALGLTPKGKRDLRWRLPDASLAPGAREKQPGRSPRKPRQRAHLMAVK